MNHRATFKGARGQVLHRLYDLRWHTYRDLATVGGVRYGARIAELLDEGWPIESAEIEGGPGKRYRLRARQRGAPRPKRVRVYLPAESAAHLLACLRRSPGWRDEGEVIAALEGAL